MIPRGNDNETKPVKGLFRQCGALGKAGIKCRPSEGSSNTQEVPLFPVLETRGMSKIAGKVRGAEELAPEAWLSVFKKRKKKNCSRVIRAWI